jgi:hypothetical protein
VGLIRRRENEDLSGFYFSRKGREREIERELVSNEGRYRGDLLEGVLKTVCLAAMVIVS